ncbi:hypothetical protein G6F46_014977 [Rhizopus delemar]|nr:hypothetical protein G6F46_014977 [Rhizopus delemar]
MGLRVAVVDELGLQVHGAADDQVRAGSGSAGLTTGHGFSVELLRGQFGVFQADRGVQPAEVFQHAFEHLHAAPA